MTSHPTLVAPPALEGLDVVCGGGGGRGCSARRGLEETGSKKTSSYHRLPDIGVGTKYKVSAEETGGSSGRRYSGRHDESRRGAKEDK